MRKTKIIGALLVTVLLVIGACGPALTPAEFEVISLVSEPSEVVVGETVSVTAVVKNTGGSEGTYVVMLTLDGVTIETKEVAITPGSSKTVTFSMVKDAPGTYEIGVGELSSTFTVKERLSDPSADLFRIAGPYTAEDYLDIIETELSLSNGYYIVKIKLNRPLPTKTDDPSIFIEWDIYIDSDRDADTGWNWPLVINDIGADYLLRLTLIDSTYTGEVINLMTNDWGSIEYEIDGDIVELRFSSETIGEPASFNFVTAVKKFGERGASGALQIADKAPNEGHYVFPDHQISLAPAPTLSYSQICLELSESYPELALDLEQLPEIKDGVSAQDLEALNDIYSLYAEAKNPEVKEAFDLMVGGGTPNPSDFQYGVPDWNTELQVLYWLAEQNEFVKDDTLAQAIAMVNGLWVTMGDDEVRQAVYQDANDLLNYFRETNEIQEVRGYSQLENYPLEAKICLGWTGNQTPVFSQKHALFLFSDNKLNLDSYEWNTISVKTLSEMQEYMDRMGWINRSVDKTVANLEQYFFFSNHWKYASPDEFGESGILIDDEEVKPWFIGNMDFEYKYYLENGIGLGVCTDEEAFVDAWCKSWGVATTALQMMKKGPSHTAIIYYEPTNAKWKVDNNQVEIFATFDPEINRDYLIFKPPLMQKGYTGDPNIIRDYLPKGWVYLPASAYLTVRENIPGEEVERLLLDGIPTSQVKDWLLYSKL